MEKRGVDVQIYVCKSERMWQHLDVDCIEHVLHSTSNPKGLTSFSNQSLGNQLLSGFEQLCAVLT